MLSLIKLEPEQLCPYKNVCSFNKKPDLCFGAKKREQVFTCNLKKLKRMYGRNDTIQKQKLPLNLHGNSGYSEVAHLHV